MPTCPRCAATTGEDDRFCMSCSQPLTEDAARERSSGAPVEATSTSLPPVLVDTSTTDLVACPGCGSSNAARRRVCARCGRRLAPEPLPDPVVEAATPAPDREAAWDAPPDTPHRPGPWRRRGLGMAVVVLGGLLGTGLGMAVALGMGPFATVEPVAFDPDAYPQDARELMPATAGSSSTAPPDGARAFGPELTVDHDLATAWVPDGEEDGALLRHGFVEPVWVDRLEIATGDQLDETTFAATARVTEVLVDLRTQRLDVTVAGTDGVQVVTLPEPVLTDEVTWEVTDTSGGVGAISEVRYVGWPADDDDREAFHQRS